MSAKTSPGVTGPALLSFRVLFGLLLLCHHFQRSCPARHSELSSLVEQAKVTLRRGISSYNDILLAMLSLETDYDYVGSDAFDTIRNHIESMNRNFVETEQIVSTYLESLDSEMLDLTVQKSRLEREKETKLRELETANAKLISYRSSQHDYRNALSTEWLKLQVSQEIQREINRRRAEAERKLEVGLGLLALPIAGWIAGGIMIAEAEKELEALSRNVDISENMVKNSAYWINYFSEQVSTYERLIDQTETDIVDVQNGIYRIEADLSSVSSERAAVGDLQSRTRRAVHQAALLRSAGSVAELQSRRLILLEPMMKVMDNVLEALKKITSEDVFYTEDMRNLVSEVRRHHLRVQA